MRVLLVDGISSCNLPWIVTDALGFHVGYFGLRLVLLPLKTKTDIFRNVVLVLFFLTTETVWINIADKA